MAIMVSSAIFVGASDPFPRMTLKQIAFTGGKARASSVHDTSGKWKPENAFQLRDSSAWYTGRDANGRGYVDTPYPHLIWYEFAEAFIPGRVSFRPRWAGCEKHHFCGATKWQLIATNDSVCDENSAWTILCEDLSGQNFKRQSISKYCVADPSNNEAFRCVGISVLEGSHHRVGVSGIRMWRKIIKN